MSDTLDLNKMVSREALTVVPKEDPTVLAARLDEQRLDSALRRKKELITFWMAGALVACLTLFSIALVGFSNNAEQAKWGRELLFVVMGGALTAFSLGKGTK